jgi:hypothetical protein
MQLITQLGKASLYRHEAYNGNTRAKITWVVRYTATNGATITARECATRKEALTWLDIYKDTSC